MMRLIILRDVFSLSFVAFFMMACSETQPPSKPSYVASEVKTETSLKPTYDYGDDLESVITGGITATPAESINALLEQGINMYSIGQQRAFSQLLGIEDESNQDTSIENSPDVPASLQQMADQLLQQYKQQIGVDPDAKVTKPKI